VVRHWGLPAEAGQFITMLVSAKLNSDDWLNCFFMIPYHLESTCKSTCILIIP
jgi:hypothetical protein